MFLGNRSHKGISAGTGDVLEANLEEFLKVDDLELEDQDGKELTRVVEEEEFVFLDE